MKLSFSTILQLLICCLTYQLVAQTGAMQLNQLKGVSFVENKHQWPAHVLFAGDIPNGKLYLHKNSFTYAFYQSQHPNHGKHKKNLNAKRETDKENATLSHSYGINLLNSSENVVVTAHNKSETKYNFIKGNNPNLWSTEVAAYNEIKYSGIYHNTDMVLKEIDGQLKYEFILTKGAHLKKIKLQYEGADSLKIINGELVVSTALGNTIEQKPYCYQTINGKKKEIKSKYVLRNNVLGFELLEKYDHSLPIVIDPELVFSTYSGSTFDNWGNTATYDSEGRLYAGGITFGYKFPQGRGRRNLNADIDMTIYKYNAKGTAAEYITYLGGDSMEIPHSLLVNNNNELIILGNTGSLNAPTSANAYDRTYNGGSFQSFDGFEFYFGTDLYIAKLNASGVLTASTYLGGSDNDGYNYFLNTNYGDLFRGDITLDASNNIIIASSTSSTDFPGLSSFSNTYKGGDSDGIVCKLSGDLSSLIWSSLIGGSNADAAYSIKSAKNGEVFVAGGTLSDDFPTSSTSNISSKMGGREGFIARISADGSSLISSTYAGSSDDDQIYFVQLDTDENVYVLGQTFGGNIPIINASVNVTNSGQFIQKFTKDLSSLMLSTVFGSGAGIPDISPTAFLVNDCDKIYVTGWGGEVNDNGSFIGSSTAGLPVTPDAFQPNTDGSDFYLCVFDKDMSSLLYATFFGGDTRLPQYNTSSGEHVDGGTCRFDPKGIVYHSVCSCGETDLPTYPTNVYSDKNNSPLIRYRDSNTGLIYFARRCNNAAFKFDLFEIKADVYTNDDTLGCSPYTVKYKNRSKGGITYDWFVDDKLVLTAADTSTSYTHTYTKAGIHKLMLVANNRTTCKLNDTDYVYIKVDTVLTRIVSPSPICFGESKTLFASIDSSLINSFIWHSGLYLNDSTISNPIATPPITTKYYVDATNENGCTKRDSVTVIVNPLPVVNAGNDTTICYGNLAKLFASGARMFTWFPSDSVSRFNIANPTTAPYKNLDLMVEGRDANGCTDIDSVTITVTYLAVTLNDALVCVGDTVQILAQSTTANSYKWSPSSYLSNANIAEPLSFPPRDTKYTINVSDAQNCKSSGLDTLWVRTKSFDMYVTKDTSICRGIYSILSAKGALSYLWDKSSGTVQCLNVRCDSVKITQTSELQKYTVTGIGTNGCKDTDTISARLRPNLVPEINFEYNQERCIGSPTQFKGKITNFDFTCFSPKLIWDFGDNTSDTILNPIHLYKKEGEYTVTLSLNGAVPTSKNLTFLHQDSCLKNIYIPNTFTPNGDGINDLLFVRGINIRKVKFYLYNNLGERVFVTEDLFKGWDGYFRGQKQTSQVFVYYCEAIFYDGSKAIKEGNITLLE